MKVLNGQERERERAAAAADGDLPLTLSLAYSWQECATHSWASVRCLHVEQANNVYAKFYLNLVRRV